MILWMLFLKISNANVSFGKKTFMWKSYITHKVLPTTKQGQIIYPKEFIIMALNISSKTFIIYVAIWEQEKMTMDPIKKAQVEA